MGDITLKKALDDYRTVYMPYRNFAERTREEYLNDLEGFIKFAQKSGLAFTRQLGLPIVERFVASLEEKGLASLTRKRKVVAIRSFLLFLYQDGYTESNIAGRVVLPFAESRIPHILTQSECNRLREVCADNPRDRAIVELLLQTGIRLSELVSLTLNDTEIEKINLIGESKGGYVRILGGRGRKERFIPLDNEACLALRNYLSIRKTSESNVFFQKRFGEPLGERGVQKMLRKYLKRAEIGRASIHTLRHTFGAQHLAKGTSLKTVQEVMGHADARSTSVYLSLANEVVRRELQETLL
jgi:integrase/recombinase XerD